MVLSSASHNSPLAVQPATRECLRTPACQLGLALWQILSGDDTLPPWEAYDSLAEPKILPHSAHLHVDLTGDRQCVSFQFVGSLIASHYGDPTGTTADAPEFGESIQQHVQPRMSQMISHCIEHSGPVVGVGAVSVDTVRRKHVEYMMLPFRTGTPTSLHILSICDFFD